MTRIDTSTVGPQERFDFWTASLYESIHPLKLRKYSQRPFNGRASAHRLAELEVFRTASDPCSVTRTAREIAVDDPESLLVVIQVRGYGTIEQGKRHVTMRPREVAMCDSSQPYVGSGGECFESVHYAIPKALLGPQADRLRQRTAQTIHAQTGLARLAVRFLLDIADGLETETLSEDDPYVSENVLGLLRALCADPRDEPIASRRCTAELALRVRASAEARLRDPDLSPESIALENKISIRYLYKLFEHTDTSVAEWIRLRRLDSCRRDLGDPALRDEPIQAIAARWGIPSAAHFSRLFRQAYGCSPREFRNSALDAAAAAPALRG